MTPVLNLSHVPSGDYVKLKIHTPMYRIAKALASPNSGLEVKDRVWLKITIPKSFIGMFEDSVQKY